MKILPKPYHFPKGAHLFLIILLLPALLFCNTSASLEKNDTVPVKEDYEQYGEPFDVPETSDIIMYELNVQAFSEQGDLEGVQVRLDSIKALGINVIWLMPIYPRGKERGIGSPYAVQNYKEVSPAYGTLEDLRELVKEAHSKDMAVILDFVANHTAWDNPWIENKTWYEQDASGEIVYPRNWQDVAQVNFDNEQLRLAVIDAMKFWVLEANIDGFRQDYADGPPEDFWVQAIDTLEAIPNRELVLLAEGGEKRHFDSGFDLNFGWNFHGPLVDVFAGGDPVSELAEANARGYTYIPEGSEESAEGHAQIPEGTHPLRFTTNHDYYSGESVISMYGGEDASVAAFFLVAYMGGVPLIYNGQEVGRDEPLEFFDDNIEKIDWTVNQDMKQQYKKLIHFRKGSEAVKSGSIQHYGDHDDVSVFKRVKGDEEVLVIVNVRDNEINYQVPSSLINTSWTNVVNDDTVNLEEQLTLQPYSYLILSN